MTRWSLCAWMVVSACAGGDEAELRVVTFNAGLAPGEVDHDRERAPRVFEAVAALEADVVCLQEVWLPEDFDALRAATVARFPTALRRPAEPSPETCTAAAMAPLEACARASCDGLCGSALQDCALDSCGEHLDGPCVSCAAAAIVGGRCVDEVISECVDADASAHLFGGAFDNVLLVAPPVLEQESRRLEAHFVRASVEYALVDGPTGAVHVFCTHLASNVSGIPYRGDHGSWEGEQARQIDQLLGFVEEKAPAGEAVVVLGDLNTGPAIADRTVAQWPGHHERLMAGGLGNPYAQRADAQCTSCPDSTFRSDAWPPKLIDHVLTRDAGGLTAASRLFTEPVTVVAEGETISTHLSDHYGLAVTLRSP